MISLDGVKKCGIEYRIGRCASGSGIVKYTVVARSLPWSIVGEVFRCSALASFLNTHL
jgi:hypothetical protein